MLDFDTAPKIATNLPFYSRVPKGYTLSGGYRYD
jgi:hypothetical protein